VVRSAGVRAELRDESGVGDSIDLVLQVFAHLESGEEIVAHVGDERPWLMLGLRGVAPEGLSYNVEELRPRPFAVEFGPRLTRALG
jgi:hypothetical protein